MFEDCGRESVGEKNDGTGRGWDEERDVREMGRRRRGG